MRANARRSEFRASPTTRHRDPFDALGNSNRRAIVELLAERPRSVREIADRLPISRPAVSRHLRVLNRAGLVADDPSGTRRLYRLDSQGAEAARRYLESVWGQVGVRFRLFAENTAAAPAASPPATTTNPSKARRRERD